MAYVKYHQFTAKETKDLKEPGTYSDGEILTIRVSKNGNKRCIQRVSINGKRHNLGLDGYPAVGPAEARRRAQDNLRAIREGRDTSRKRGTQYRQPRKGTTCPRFVNLPRKRLTSDAPP